jgi:hypothetical protein
MAVVIVVSLRDGQVTRPTSWRTCRRNSTGLPIAMMSQSETAYIAPKLAARQPVTQATGIEARTAAYVERDW